MVAQFVMAYVNILLRDRPRLHRQLLSSVSPDVNPATSVNGEVNEGLDVSPMLPSKSVNLGRDDSPWICQPVSRLQWSCQLNVTTDAGLMLAVCAWLPT